MVNTKKAKIKLSSLILSNTRPPLTINRLSNRIRGTTRRPANRDCRTTRGEGRYSDSTNRSGGGCVDSKVYT